jgi:hypothetical protein
MSRNLEACDRVMATSPERDAHLREKLAVLVPAPRNHLLR